MKETRTRNWAFVFYPESTREDWQNVLSEKGLQVAVSPLHDSDKFTKDVVDKDSGEILHRVGDTKKEHYHAILIFDSVKTREQVQAVAQLIAKEGTTAPAVQSVLNLRGAMRYLIHLDDPKKAQYAQSDIVTIGGIDWAYYAMSQSDLEQDTRNRITAVLNLMAEFELHQFDEVVDCVLAKTPELFEVVRKNAYFFGAYCKRKIYKKNPCQEEENFID